MEHVPIKKRRFLFRCPSPIPQSPKDCEESQKLDSSMCKEQQTYISGNTEIPVTAIDFSESVCKKRVVDGDVQNTISSYNRVPFSSEDLSGIAILAAAACSGGIDCTVVDDDTTKMGDLPERDDNVTINSTTNMTKDELNANLNDATMMGDSPERVDNVTIDSTPDTTKYESNIIINDGRSPSLELSEAAPNELVVSETSRVKTIELPVTVNDDVLCGEDKPSGSPRKDVEIAGKTAQASDGPRNYRLHWDLNTIMDDWDHPVDDTFASSCMTSAEVAATSAMSIQKSVTVEASTSGERVLANECGDTFNDESTGNMMLESLTGSGSDMSISSLDVSSDHVTSHLKGISSLPGTNCYATQKENVSNARGYDCHLEDGELRESDGHGWEDAETEQVDYDSDDRDGIFFEAANDESMRDDFSFQHQRRLSTVDVKPPKSCFGDQRKEGGPKGWGRSHSGTDKFGQDVAPDLRGACASGRRFLCADRRKSADSMRSRSSNFGGMLQVDCSESDHQPLVQSAVLVPDSRQEGKVTILNVPEDTSLRGGQSRMISTSRNEYNPMRRSSSGEREDFHDTMKVSGRDSNLDNNSRSKFDRFSDVPNRRYKEGYQRQGTLRYFGKGERSFSPCENRLDSHHPRSHRKSRSRSRTRSPDFRSESRRGRGRFSYQPPGHSTNYIRGRSSGRGFNPRPRFNNMGSPGRLRSNDDHMRFHDANRDSDYEESNQYRRKPFYVHSDCRSLSRSRSISPDFRPNTRVSLLRTSYQPSTGPNRGRRSSVRVFSQIQRYDNRDSPERFNDNPQSGRGNDYCNREDEYRKKPRNIFERIHPVRHYDEVRVGRRFQYHERDNLNNRNFRRNDNYTQGGDRAPVEFRRDERSTARYNSDRMFYSGPKQFRDGAPTSKTYSNEDYSKIAEEQLNASEPVRQGVTPSLHESRVEPVIQSQAQPIISSSLPENPMESERLP